MSDILLNFLQELDSTNADVTQNLHITSQLGQIAQDLEKEGDNESARFARIEQEVLSASKSLESKVGYHISGINKDENGNEQEFGWPDTSGYGAAEYTYIKSRFEAVSNLYIKSEYGFFLYLKKQAGRPEEVASLVRVFFELSHYYFALEATATDYKHYVLHSVQTLAIAFRIAVSRQRDVVVAKFLDPIASYIFEIQQRWDATRTGTPMLFGTFTSLVAEQPSLFQRNNILVDFLEKNKQAIATLSSTYRYGAMELAQASSQLAKQTKLDTRPWQLLVAEQYEHLAQEAIDNQNAAAVSFTQQALRIYQELGDTQKVSSLEISYQQLRTKFSLNTVRTEIPADESRARLESIMKEIAERTEDELITIIALSPMFPSVQNVRDYALTAEKMFSDLFSTTIEDKHGNPVQTFATEEEKQEFRVLNAYGFLGQVATQTLVKLMLEAYKAGKLTLNGIRRRIAGSWLGQPRLEQEHGNQVETQPLKLIDSGVRVLFHELDRWRNGETDEPDFIAATDSLVLKVEYILRYMCSILGIPTFRPKKDGIVHEKLIDELLRSLDDSLDVDDAFLIRFYLQEKAGQNLRNRVAHGLMDDTEYGVENVFLVLCIILKLASYEFTPRTNE